MAQATYQNLIEKLDQFIRKYYVNQLIKGSLLWLGLCLALFLAFSFLEYQFWFGSGTRKFIFYSFLFVSIGSLAFWVGIPVLKYFRLGERIGHDEAAKIIGTHFTEVKDKLLNIIQLHKQGATVEDNSLILASIDQKSAEIKSVPFLKAIDLSKNKKYLRFALPPVFLGLGILLIAPYIITDASQRIIKNNKEFEKPAPFRFVLEEAQPEVVQFNDYNLHLHTEGEVNPAELFIKINNFTYRLSKNDEGEFTYTFKQVRENTPFRIFSGDVQSPLYELKVIEKPQLATFTIDLDFPAYTGLKDKSLENVGDVTIPEGTTIDWTFQTSGVERLELEFEKDSLFNSQQKGENLFRWRQQIFDDQLYKVLISSAALTHADSALYRIKVIEDNYPIIKAERFIDSTNVKRLFFAGEAGDDYGLSDLLFHYKIKSEDGEESFTDRLSAKGNPMTFEHSFDIDSLSLDAGDELIYFFEVYDNDAVNGRKSARSKIMSYRKPTLEEFEEQEQKQQSELEDRLERNLRKQEEIKKNVEDLYNKLLNQKEMEWQDRKEMEKILQQQEELQKMIEVTKKKLEEKQEAEEEFQEKSEEQKQQEEQLKKELEELEKNEEMQKLMEKIQELLQEMKREEALDMLQEKKQQDQQMELNMDRLEKMLKQLEFEKDLQDQMEKIQEMAEKQEQLRKETQEGQKEDQQLEKEQQKLNEEFDEIKKETDKLEKKSKQINSSPPMEQMNEQMEDIQREMQEAQEELSKGNKQKAQEHQKKAQEKMQQMQEQMQGGMNGSAMQQMEEDVKTLRQLLEQLVTISFEQERLISGVRRTSALTPKFGELTQRQFKLQEDFGIVEDSLIALSKRNMQIESFILKEVSEIKDDFSSTLGHLEEREKNEAGRYQQLAMTNVNDLALMLSEAMQNMQQQMSNMMPGSQMCNKPKPSMKPGEKSGKNSIPMDKITEGQKKLNEAMKKMAEENQKKQQKGGQGKSSEDFARMAQEQAKLRKMLRDLQGEKRSLGQGDQQLQEIIDQMNQTETDLVNKRLTNEMLRRQQEIVTRLLESEKAERQQEQKEQREAERAKEIARQQKPAALEQYLKERSSSIDQIRTVSPSLSPYYRELVESYYQRLGNGK